MNAHHPDEPRNAEPTAPAANGRRRFLLGAAGLAATPLLLGTVGCTATAPAGSTPPSSSLEPSPATPATSSDRSVDAAITMAGRRTLGALEVSRSGWAARR